MHSPASLGAVGERDGIGIRTTILVVTLRTCLLSCILSPLGTGDGFYIGLVCAPVSCAERWALGRAPSSWSRRSSALKTLALYALACGGVFFASLQAEYTRAVLTTGKLGSGFVGVAQWIASLRQTDPALSISAFEVTIPYLQGIAIAYVAASAARLAGQASAAGMDGNSRRCRRDTIVAGVRLGRGYFAMTQDWREWRPARQGPRGGRVHPG